jgi:F-type H+/Na+-transporting ATPase subunit alpha
MGNEQRAVGPDTKAFSGAERGVREQLERIHWGVRHREVGTVVSSGDGIAHVRGLSSAGYGELVETAEGLTGLVFDVEREDLGILFLDPADHIGAGDELRATGRVASVPAGDELLGRVVDALGRPLDGGLPIRRAVLRPVEREAPGVAQRMPVHEPLHTGTKVIDALLPIGRGQRELLVGDHATGKTSIALDAMIAQRETGVVCVYAAIGLRQSTVAEVIESLGTHGALAHSIIVVASADSAPGQQYLAPYAACAIAEYFVEQGRHALVIYDNLTKHADAYRRIGLLFGRPPSREAYPPDVFYLHARLLERAARLSDRLGGGSMTALPIVDTQLGNIAAYIPTNVISITDGQIFLDARLFNAGVRPAIDVGLSVSRIGGKAQPALLRALSGDLRLVYAGLQELEMFARFGAELEPEARQRLERGRRVREVFKQPRLTPLRLGYELVTLFAVREGYLDAVPVEKVGIWLQALYQRLETAESTLLEELEGADRLEGELETRLRRSIEATRRDFARGV